MKDQILTSRLVLKPWSDDDAQDFFELSQDDGFNLFPIKIYRQKTIEASRSWIRENPKGKWAVRSKDRGNVLGLGGLTPWNCDGEDLVDVTYRLRESAWGQGLGFELAEALVLHGFHHLSLTQITATIRTDNLPSKKIADKLGMTFSKQIELMGATTDLYRLYK